MAKDSPLGQATDYPDTYAPELLFPIARSDNRPADMPEFCGCDVWNAWELTWLGERGMPRAGVAEIRVPAESANIVESKSLKLYLNSFSMSRFASRDEVRRRIAEDLSAAAGAEVGVRIDDADVLETVALLPGESLDDIDIACDRWEVDPGPLTSDSDDIVEESLHTHLLRSLCPVTAQPDTGSLLISYRGPRIEREGLLRYIVSFRRHTDFHEACVERIFKDLTERCGPESLTVYARYQRRGGIDINPYRSTEPGAPDNPRLWRQ
ncbi:MAG: NADPH-dependent 7-cyano-7-deazaguanine reductase QueF [Woeseiaceae bacterium]|nr:NADPH-dependent 7-cyano-7-deazaguanine reductase QueF [Woeseiaceae bacterium]